MLPQLFDLPLKPIPIGRCSFADGRVVGDHWNEEAQALGVRGLTDISTGELGTAFLALPECQLEPPFIRLYLGPDPRPDNGRGTCWALFRHEGAMTLVPFPRDEVARMIVATVAADPL